ncbi:hypothetical protein AA313_de0203598 [Arthrobotrys entomopaga]|nr:hypothetical protein AA313_de0203598 [Arthrobotrys entomopaga]
MKFQVAILAVLAATATAAPVRFKDRLITKAKEQKLPDSEIRFLEGVDQRVYDKLDQMRANISPDGKKFDAMIANKVHQAADELLHGRLPNVKRSPSSTSGFMMKRDSEADYNLEIKNRFLGMAQRTGKANVVAFMTTLPDTFWNQLWKFEYEYYTTKPPAAPEKKLFEAAVEQMLNGQRPVIPQLTGPFPVSGNSNVAISGSDPALTSSPAAGAESTPAAAIPTTAAADPVGANPVVSTPAAADPVASMPAGADPAASMPAAADPAATMPAAADPMASMPAAGAVPSTPATGADPVAADPNMPAAAGPSTPATPGTPTDPMANQPVANQPAGADPAAGNAMPNIPVDMVGTTPAAASPVPNIPVDMTGQMPVGNNPAAANPVANTPATPGTPGMPADPAAANPAMNAAAPVKTRK